MPRDEPMYHAIIDQNCLGKQTVSTRKLTCQRLSELYGLDPSIPLFPYFAAIFGRLMRMVVLSLLF